MKDYKKIIEYKKAEIESLLNELKEAEKNTTKFLDECLKSNIKTVSIGIKTEKVPTTLTWPFSTHGSVFQLDGIRDKDGWPAIWGVVDRAGLKGSCGNSNQKQINNDKDLSEGVYEFKRGKWLKVE